MANFFHNLLGPVAPGVSPTINPISMIGAGMYSGNPAAALAQMGRMQQAGQELQARQAMNQRQLAMMEAEEARKQELFEQEQKTRTALRAIAPDVVAQMGLPSQFAQAPELVSNLYLQSLKAGMPSAGMKQFAQFQAMSPEQKQEFLAYQRSMSPFAGMQTYMSPLGDKAANWTNQEGKQPQPGMTPEQASSAGFYPRPKSATPEEAGKKAAISVAGETLSNVRNAVIGPNGEIDRGLVATMAMNAPFSQGRLERARLVDVLQTKLRAETGAQANESEVQSVLDRYLPSAMDSDAGIIDKFDRLDRFFELSIKETNPTLYETLQKRAKERAEVPAGFVED